MLSTKQRTIIIYAIIGVFIAGVAWIIIAYFAASTLTLTTNDLSNTLLIHENKPTPRNIDISQNGKEVIARLEAGNYTVTAQNKVTSTAQVIDIGIGEHKTITLNLSAASSIIMSEMPVTSLGAIYFTASENNITFVDSNNPNNPLYSVDQTNHTKLVDGKHTYTSIRWADASFGIGFVSYGTTNHGVVKIDNTNVSDVVLPFSPDEAFSYAVSPNRTWYVSDGHTIYRANGDGSFTKIYTTDVKSSVTIASASNNAIILTQKVSAVAREGSLIILHNDGTKYQIEGELYNSAWSPSGDKVVTTGDTAEIFDDKLNPIRQLPQGNFISPVWLDDNTLVYGLGSNVWRYKLDTGRAEIIVSLDPLLGAFSVIKPDSEHNFLYASLYSSNSTNPTYSLKRISLGNKQAPDPTTAQHLGIILPLVDSTCSVNFMNFTSLTVLTKQTAPGQNCVATARNSFVDSKIMDAASVSALNFEQIQ